MMLQEEVDKLVQAIKSTSDPITKDMLWAMLCTAGIHDYEFVSLGSASGALLECAYCGGTKLSKPWSMIKRKRTRRRR